jgi:surface protein
MSVGRLSSKLASKKNLGKQPTPWVRDPNWTTLPDITGQQKFVGLYAIFEESNYIALSATTSAGTYTVDWGDGSSTVAIASGTQANYLYDYASVSGSPITHNGLTYKQVIVTVTPTTANLTGINLNLKNNASTGFAGLSAYDSSWLDISVNGANLTSITIASPANQVVPRLLESATIGQHSGGFGNYSYMFNGCVNLRNVSISSSSSNVTNTTNMFNACRNLTSVPLFNTAAVTAMDSMFSGCSALSTVPLFNTASATGMTSMFSGCASLTTVPLFNTASATGMASMFSGCASLTTVPLFNTASATSMTSMFSGCSSLTTVPLFNTAAVTGMNLMFSSCSSLTTVPLFNTAAVTGSMSSMFSSCIALTTVPLFNTAAVTNMGSMFSVCTSLTTVPLFNTALVTNMSTMFNGCSSLTSLPALNTASAPSSASLASMFATCVNLSKIAMTGFRFTFSVTALKLSKTSLELLFSNLGIGTSQTLTITTNPGADTAVSLTGTTAAQSTTITMASTAGLSTGMSVSGTGTGITTGASVTFQDAGDTVTLASHGLSNGGMVSFSVITTTTGIVINTIYYVISATTNTFQVSATSGGSALVLTTDGSGTLKYNAKIVTINTNVSVVLDRPAATTAAGATLAFRILNTSQATLRGWAITG